MSLEAGGVFSLFHTSAGKHTYNRLCDVSWTCVVLYNWTTVTLCLTSWTTCSPFGHSDPPQLPSFCPHITWMRAVSAAAYLVPWHSAGTIGWLWGGAQIKEHVKLLISLYWHIVLLNLNVFVFVHFFDNECSCLWLFWEDVTWIYRTSS